MATTAEFDRILSTVAGWPSEQRAALANALTESLRPTNGQKPTLHQLVGIARGPGAPPTDAQVDEWIEEHRTGKYGR